MNQPPDPLADTSKVITPQEDRKAAEKKEQSKLARLYSHGSDEQKIASEYLKDKGIEGFLLPFAENRFIDGYQVAKKKYEEEIRELKEELKGYYAKTECL
jgi:hypothetical protein